MVRIPYVDPMDPPEPPKDTTPKLPPVEPPPEPPDPPEPTLATPKTSQEAAVAEEVNFDPYVTPEYVDVKPVAQYTAKQMMDAWYSADMERYGQIRFEQLVSELTGLDLSDEFSFDQQTHWDSVVKSLKEEWGISPETYATEARSWAMGIHTGLFSGFTFNGADNLPPVTWENLLIDEEEFIEQDPPTNLYSVTGLLETYGVPMGNDTFMLSAEQINTTDIVLYDNNLNPIELDPGWYVQYRVVDGKGFVTATISASGWSFMEDGTAYSPGGASYDSNGFHEYVTQMRKEAGDPNTTLMEYFTYASDDPEADFSYFRNYFEDMTLTELIETMTISNDELKVFYNPGTGLTETEFVTILAEVVKMDDYGVKKAMLEELGFSEKQIIALDELYKSKEDNIDKLNETLLEMGIDKARPLYKLFGKSDEDLEIIQYNENVVKHSAIAWKTYEFDTDYAQMNSLQSQVEDNSIWEYLGGSFWYGVNSAYMRLKTAGLYWDYKTLLNDTPPLGDPTGYCETYTPVVDWGSEWMDTLPYAQNALKLKDMTDEEREELANEKLYEIFEVRTDFDKKFNMNPKYAQLDWGGKYGNARFLNPVYFTDVILRELPTTAAVMATMGAGSVVGGPIMGVSVGVAVAASMESAEIFSNLVEAGYDPKEAQTIANYAGLASGTIEALSDWAVMGLASPITNSFRTAFINNVISATTKTAIKALKAGGTVILMENIEEVTQAIIANAAMNAVMETPLMTWDEFTDIVEQTSIASLPFAFLGGRAAVKGQFFTIDGKAVDEMPTLYTVNPSHFMEDRKVTIQATEDMLKATPENQRTEEDGWKLDELTQIWYREIYTESLFSYALAEYEEKLGDHTQALVKAWNTVFVADPQLRELVETELKILQAQYQLSKGEDIKEFNILLDNIIEGKTAVEFTSRDYNRLIKAVSSMEESNLFMERIEDLFQRTNTPLLKAFRIKFRDAKTNKDLVHIRRIENEARLKKLHEREDGTVEETTDEFTQEDNRDPNERRDFNEYHSKALRELAGRTEKVATYIEWDETQREALSQLQERVHTAEMAETEKLKLRDILLRIENNEPVTINELMKVSPYMDPHTRQALKTLTKIEQALNRKFDQQSKIINFAQAVWFMPRIMQTSGDLSAIMRQGSGMLGEAQFFPKAILHSLKSVYELGIKDEYGNPKYGEVYATRKTLEMEDWLQTNFQEAMDLAKKKWGIDLLAGTDEGITAHEEVFIGAATMNIPYLSDYLINSSERAYTMFLNDLRLMVFKKYATEFKKLEQRGATVTVDHYADLIYTCNVLTGRGSFGEAGKWYSVKDLSKVLTVIFYAPRLMLSYPQRYAHLVNQGLYHGLMKNDPVARVMARILLRNLGAQAMFVGTLCYLAQIAFGFIAADGDDDEDAPVIYNPVEALRKMDPGSVFSGRIKIGNSTIDLTGGYGSYLRLIYTLATDERTKTSTGQKVDVDKVDQLLHSARGKLSPWMGVLVDALTGSTYIGEEVNFSEEYATSLGMNLVLPLSLQTLIESLEYNDGEMALLLMLPEIIGMNVTTWDTRYWEDEIQEWRDGEMRESYVDANGDYHDPAYPTTSTLWQQYVLWFGDITSEHMTPQNVDLYKFTPLDIFFVETHDLWIQYEKLFYSKTLKDISEDEMSKIQDKGYFTKEEIKAWQTYLLASPEAKKAMLRNPYYADMLAVTPQQKKAKWLEEHPHENAMLAFWGKIDTKKQFFTEAAYKEFKKFIEKYDAPKTGFKDGVLLPEQFEESYFTYMDLAKTFDANDAHLKQFFMENPALTQFLGYTVPDENKERIDLKVKYADEWTVFKGFSDEESQYYIDDEESRAAVELEYLKKHDDFWTAYVIESKFKDGTTEYRNDNEEYLEKYIEFYKIVMDKDYLSDEAMYFLSKDMNFTKWALANELTIGTLDLNLIKNPRYYELQFELAPQDAEYAMYLTTEAQQAYMKANQEYAMKYFERQMWANEVPAGLSPRYTQYYVLWRYRDFMGIETWKNDYAEFYSKRPEGESCYADDWFLLDHWAFYIAMRDISFKTDGKYGIAARDFSKARALRKVWDKWVYYWTVLPQYPRSARRNYKNNNPDLKAYFDEYVD